MGRQALLRLTHEPLYLENTANRRIVVFIHGFMGTPRQFDEMAKIVHSQGYSAASLLLPGHGSTVKDFSSGTMNNWQEHVDAEIERFSRSNDSIYLVGHSMGCLLAINAAVKHSKNISGIFLIACPFKLRLISIHSAKIKLKLVFCRRSHPMKSVYLAASSVPLRPSLAWRAIGPYIELKKLARIAKASLGNIRAPINAVYSTADDVVSVRSLKILKAGISQAPFECLILSESLHAYFPEHEQRIIEASLKAALVTVP